MQTVGLLYGGRSSEHEISRLSAATVARNLDPRRYRLILIAIVRSGVWYVQPEAYSAQMLPADSALTITRDPNRRVFVRPGEGLATDSGPLAVDILFPMLHGANGEDGTMQGLLEIADMPYVGADVAGSAVCARKALAKRLWMSAGLQVVPFLETSRAILKDNAAIDELFRQAAVHLGLPLFVKPESAGSSVGVTRVTEQAGFRAALGRALEYDDRALIEQAVRGREIECAVLGSSPPRGYSRRHSEIEAAPPGEVVPRSGFYDYEAKYIDPDGAALKVPAELSTSVRARIRDIATRAFIISGADGMARVDFFVTADNTIYLNEINTIPGFTAISMYPRLFAAAGLSCQRLLDRLIAMGHKRYHERRHRRRDYAPGNSRIAEPRADGATNG